MPDRRAFTPPARTPRPLPPRRSEYDDHSPPRRHDHSPPWRQLPEVPFYPPPPMMPPYGVPPSPNMYPPGVYPPPPGVLPFQPPPPPHPGVFSQPVPQVPVMAPPAQQHPGVAPSVVPAGTTNSTSQSVPQMIFIPASQAVPASQPPPYIVVTDPVNYESVSSSEHEPRKSRKSKADGGTNLNDSINLAKKAAKNMRHLTEKMKSKE